MQTALIRKAYGGSDDVYSFTLGETTVEVFHYEDGEYRSDCYMEPAQARALWVTLQEMGYNDNGLTPDFVPDDPEAIVGASDAGCKAWVAFVGCIALSLPVWWGIVHFFF